NEVSPAPTGSAARRATRRGRFFRPLRVGLGTTSPLVFATVPAGLRRSLAATPPGRLPRLPARRRRFSRPQVRTKRLRLLVPAGSRRLRVPRAPRLRPLGFRRTRRVHGHPARCGRVVPLRCLPVPSPRLVVL